MSMPNISLSQKARQSEEVLFQELNGEGVLLDLASESYFGLNQVGTRIWALIGEDPSLRRAFDRLRAEFDVEPQRLESDIIALIQEMADAGLVHVT